MSPLPRPVCLVQPTLFPEASRVDIYEYSCALARLGVETHVVVSENRSPALAGLTVHETRFAPRNTPGSWWRFAAFARATVRRLVRERDLGLVAQALREVLLARTGYKPALATPTFVQKLSKLDEDAILERIETLIDHARMIDLNANVGLCVEDALLRV